MLPTYGSMQLATSRLQIAMLTLHCRTGYDEVALSHQQLRTWPARGMQVMYNTPGAAERLSPHPSAYQLAAAVPAAHDRSCQQLLLRLPWQLLGRQDHSCQLADVAGCQP